jgi:exonuclease III
MKSKRTDISSKSFGMKWKMRIGFWNIRTLREYGKLKQVEKEMKNYKLDIMALSEIRWKDNGEIKTQDRNSLIFSGMGEEKEHRDGVGILMSKEA